MINWKNVYLRAGGVALQAAAAFTLLLSMDAESAPGVLLGIVVGAHGLILWGWGSRTPLLAPPAEQELPKSVPAPAQQQVLQQQRMEQILEGLQADVAQLREDREFFRELYAGERDRP